MALKFFIFPSSSPSFLVVPSFPGMAVVTVSCSFSMPFLPLSLASLNSRFVRVAARLFVVVVVFAAVLCLCYEAKG